MIVIPAIDILGGKCVRLARGRYTTARKVAEDPVKAAKDFEASGAELIHLVDLDGAREGRCVNTETFQQIVENVQVPVQVGGGIRNMETVDYYLEHGVSRVVLGTAAYENKELVMHAIDKYGSKIAVGIDAELGYVKIAGWTESIGISYLELAKISEKMGAQTIIYTDISCDGMLCGPNYEHLKQLRDSLKVNIIASGGIRDIRDIEKLKAIGMHGAICGKSLYDGSLSLYEAVEMAR